VIFSTPTPTPTTPFPLPSYSVFWEILLGPLIVGLLLLLAAFWGKSIWTKILFAKSKPDRVYKDYLKSRLKNVQAQHILKVIPGLELNEIYQEIELIPVKDSKLTNSLIQTSDDRFAGVNQPIEYYLNSTKKNESGHRFVIVSPSGSGKSTLLFKIALDMINKRNKEGYKKIPILIQLNGLGDIKTKTLQGVIGNPIMWQKNVSEYIIEKFSKGECLVMFDSLDEIGDLSSRKHAIEWINEQVAPSKNDLIITSRPYGYSDFHLTSTNSTLEISKLNDEQIHDYLIKWFRKMGKEGYGDLLYKKITRPTYKKIMDLAGNPLLLSIIAIVYSESLKNNRDDLPYKHIELYERICNILMYDKPREKGNEKFLDVDKLSILEETAYLMMCQNLTIVQKVIVFEIIENQMKITNKLYDNGQLLKYIEESSGLFYQFRDGEFMFAHLTFQEYLASSYIRKNGLENELLARCDNQFWFETIRFYAAAVDATNIISTCLKADPFTPYLQWLAEQCSKITPDLDPQIDIELKKRLKEVKQLL
jgi:predicted NACHT family NTPase